MIELSRHILHCLERNVSLPEQYDGIAISTKRQAPGVTKPRQTRDKRAKAFLRQHGSHHGRTKKTKKIFE
jgi:hypothetical protein